MRPLEHTDKSHGFTMHVDAQLKKLEQLAPAVAPQLRSRFVTLQRGMVAFDSMRNIEREVSSALQGVAKNR